MELRADVRNRIKEVSLYVAILYVTSFTAEMFRVSGTRLLNSFVRSGTEGTLLVCHEGFEGRFPAGRIRLRTYPLKRAALLTSWISENREVIPRRFGGAARTCGCPSPSDPFSRHVPRCHGYWFNRNACRWFRKIVSLDYALTLGQYETFIWVDSDCVFKAALPERVVNGLFQENAVFYLKSRARQVMESGVVGIRNNFDGRRFITATRDRYRSGAFREDPRWDDSYQFQRTLRDHSDIPSVDLATHAIGRGQYGHVLPCSPLGPYIFHQKGLHARVLRELR